MMHIACQAQSRGGSRASPIPKLSTAATMQPCRSDDLASHHHPAPQRQGELQSEAHLEPLLFLRPQEGFPNFRPPRRTEVWLIPTLSMTRLCPSIHPFADERIPSGHSGERAISSRILVGIRSRSRESNHYAASRSRSSCLLVVTRGLLYPWMSPHGLFQPDRSIARSNLHC